MTHTTFHSLTQAIETYYEELQQFIRQRTGSPSMAEDVVQDAWIRATTATLPDHPRAYLYRMVGNLAVDQLRREGARERFEGSDNDDMGIGALIDQVPSPAPNPVEITISRQELAALNAAVRELPDKCREAFLLYRGQSLSTREVATCLSISEKTVEKHIARAMVHCRMRLREAGRDV